MDSGIKVILVNSLNINLRQEIAGKWNLQQIRVSPFKNMIDKLLIIHEATQDFGIDMGNPYFIIREKQRQKEIVS